MNMFVDSLPRACTPCALDGREGLSVRESDESTKLRGVSCKAKCMQQEWQCFVVWELPCDMLSMMPCHEGSEALVLCLNEQSSILTHHHAYHMLLVWDA